MLFNWYGLFIFVLLYFGCFYLFLILILGFVLLTFSYSNSTPILMTLLQTANVTDTPCLRLIDNASSPQTNAGAHSRVWKICQNPVEKMIDREITRKYTYIYKYVPVKSSNNYSSFVSTIFNVIQGWRNFVIWPSGMINETCSTNVAQMLTAQSSVGKVSWRCSVLQVLIRFFPQLFDWKCD